MLRQFFQRLQLGLRNFMEGRYGTDKLNMTILCAGLAVNSGLSMEEGWRAITINPAVATGIGDRVGSLEPGKDGDIVVWTADPLTTLGGEAWMTVVDGKIVYKA